MQLLWRCLCLCLFTKHLVFCMGILDESPLKDSQSMNEEGVETYSVDDYSIFDRSFVINSPIPLSPCNENIFDDPSKDFGYFCDDCFFNPGEMNYSDDSCTAINMTYEDEYEDPQPETTTKRPHASTMTKQPTKNPRKGPKFSTDCFTQTATASSPRVLPPRQDPYGPLSMLKAHIFLKIRRQFNVKTNKNQKDFILHRWDHFPPSVSIYPDGWTEEDLRLIEDSIDDLEFVHMTYRQLRVHRERCSCISDPQSHMDGVSRAEQREDAGYKSPFLASLSTALASNVEMPVFVPVFPSTLAKERKKIVSRLESMLRQQHGDFEMHLWDVDWENWPQHIPKQVGFWYDPDMAEIWRIIYTVKFVPMPANKSGIQYRCKNSQRNNVQNMMLRKFCDEAGVSAKYINWRLADTSNIPSEYCILKFTHKMMTNSDIRNNHAIMDNIHFVPKYIKKAEEEDIKIRILRLYHQYTQTKVSIIQWSKVRLVGCPDDVNFSDLHLSEIRFLAKNFDSLHFIPAVA